MRNLFPRGEFVKQAFLECSETLFADFKERDSIVINNITATGILSALHCSTTTLLYCIARHGKPLLGREFVKKAFLECSETLFADFKERDSFVINNITSAGILSALHCSTTILHTTTLLYCIARHEKPLPGGEFVKQAFLECSEYLSADFEEKDSIVKRINELPICHKTVKDRVQYNSGNPKFGISDNYF
ncbi:hypothetical protein AVEN_148661-1 [Araneus ventricosus]|uniref:Uncharacterized protein n=1 Tax=Araneus ventricosus TaxID=182803 RepID=A0A4Y2QD36_ARAVE|nr:hypothetical protein AVEN_252649-1 [Araneus ventricosus]GBN60547.1 hypothetical protein AVEN_110346-1 [Araneus ventricosus]GBN60565.1 hypothetical protein AVEN_148661-1 [Araneus ventricosus]